MLVATLVVPPQSAPLTSADVSLACDAIHGAGGHVLGQDWLEMGHALDLFVSEVAAAQVRALLEALFETRPLDVFVMHKAHRAVGVFIADMDSTMIGVECIDELADFVGRKAQVAAITEAAMRGELDFAGALRERVALLAGLEEAALQRCYDERVAPALTPGGKALVRTLGRRGVTTLLVSGGFTFFVDRVAEVIGFADTRANVLAVQDGKLTGQVVPPIVDSAIKRETLLAARALAPADQCAAVAIGDGANDIPMIEAAELGIAFYAKPKTQAAADAAIRHNDLTAVLFALGIARAHWVLG